MENIMKIIKSLEDSSLSLKGVSETIQNEAKEQKGGSLSMLLGTLGATLLGNMLAKSQGRGIIEQDMVLKIFNQKEMEWLELVMDLNKMFNSASSFN